MNLDIDRPVVIEQWRPRIEEWVNLCQRLDLRKETDIDIEAQCVCFYEIGAFLDSTNIFGVL
jgi:hypothetical protein